MLKNVKNTREKETIESKEKMLNSQADKRSSQNIAKSITEDVNLLINIKLAQKNARKNKVLTRPLKRADSPTQSQFKEKETKVNINLQKNKVFSLTQF